MSRKKIFITIIILILISAIFAEPVYSRNNYIKDNTEDFIKNEDLIAIDEKFMEDIRNNLTNIIDNQDFWQGRYFGTLGEIKSAEILYNALENIVPKIEYDDLNADYCKKIGINSVNDVSLIINNEIIPESEFFPMFTPIRSDKEHLIENAQILLPPDIIYNTACDEKNKPPIFRPGSDYIYLIDMTYFENDYDIYLSVFKLFLFTRLNPIWPVAEAFLCADYNEKTHFMPITTPSSLSSICFLPGFMISGKLGNKIKNEQTIVDRFYIHQYYKTDFPSKNVIVTLPGESDEVIFVGTKLDSMPCRGAADDSGSMSIVWGVAKYFAENNIRLNYTLKFGAWAAEEFYRSGSKSYVDANPEEIIRYYIGLGAIGYINDSNTKKSDLHLNIHSPKKIDAPLKEKISYYDYQQKSGGYGNILFKINDPMLTKTDSSSFIDHTSKNVFSIDKGDYSTATHWYHRSGGNHKYGDVPEVLDNQDIKAVAELIIEIIQFVDSEPN